MTNKTIGKFEILETLGQGGYGTVYRVRDTILNVDRALKVLHPVLLADPTFLERFKREAQILARLEHPHIVPVHEMDQISEHVYISMKYVPSGSLKDVLKRQGRLSFGRAVEISDQIASALVYAYAQPEKLIHRDIKPSNILFEKDGSVRLSDFGFAKALAGADSISLSASGGMIGTPNYMAPEIWRGKGATAATDVYSLACVFYEMITGEMLFPGESPPEIMTVHIIDGAQFPKQWQEGIPEGIESVLKKALTKEFQERFQSAEEFTAALARLQEVKQKEGTKAAQQKGERPVKRTESKLGAEPKREDRAPKEAQEIKPETEEIKTGEFAGASKREEPRKKEIKETGDGVKIGQTEIDRGWMVGGVAAFLLLLIVCIGVVIWIVNTSIKPTPTPEVVVVEITSTQYETEAAVEMTAVPAIETDTPIPPSGTPTRTATKAQSGIFVDDHGVKMAWIPAGSFMMGSEAGSVDEQPIHEVYLDTYAIDVYEVTNEIYEECVTDGACDKPGGSYYGDAQYDDHPVAYVNWNDASAYCEWRGGRLPTEAEWEKAARGGLEGKLYPWGDEEPICQKGAKNGAQYDECDGDTVAVSSFAANGYGLYDMAGNVWEWVADWYDSGYYGKSDYKNPLGPATGSFRVLRGGSWYNDGVYLRAAYRNYGSPFSSYDWVGFRCAASPPGN